MCPFCVPVLLATSTIEPCTLVALIEAVCELLAEVPTLGDECQLRAADPVVGRGKYSRSASGAAQMPRVTVNGAELYYEIRGTGPPLLLIMGATGDGGHFDELADLLADEFTVVTYDRRGNGRSPVPAGWRTTSAEEQADDAAALLDALEIGPAAVFGTSSGGTFALCLLVRHAEHVRGLILHEPGLYSLVDDFDAVRAPIRALVEEAREAGGPSAAVERFWCYIVENEDGWNRLAPSLRERLRATATHVVRG